MEKLNTSEYLLNHLRLFDTCGSLFFFSKLFIKIICPIYTCRIWVVAIT